MSMFLRAFHREHLVHYGMLGHVYSRWIAVHINDLSSNRFARGWIGWICIGKVWHGVAWHGVSMG